MESGKKLSCGHVFHFYCLRSWLEWQQTCPTCRHAIPITSPSPVTVPPAPAPAVVQPHLPVPTPVVPLPVPTPVVDHVAATRSSASTSGDGETSARTIDSVTGDVSPSVLSACLFADPRVLRAQIELTRQQLRLYQIMLQVVDESHVSGAAEEHKDDTGLRQATKLPAT